MSKLGVVLVSLGTGCLVEVRVFLHDVVLVGARDVLVDLPPSLKHGFAVAVAGVFQSSACAVELVGGAGGHVGVSAVLPVKIVRKI